MEQLYFLKKGKLEWREVKKPILSSPNQAIVRPFAVAKCDLDDAFLFNNLDLQLKLGGLLRLVDKNYKQTFGNLLKGPFPFGHECVGQVIEIGEQVKNIKIGDVVSVPFQISCGNCPTCQQGFTSSCESVAPISTFGFGKHLEFGGAMSDYIKVPFADAMLLKIPPHLDPIQLASLSDNIPDAYRHVKSLEFNPKQSVLIISGKAKSVGIYALMMAKAMGVEQIEYLDNNQERLRLAQEIGATNIYSEFKAITKKYDVVIDASSSTKGLTKAFESIRNYGTVTSSGIYIKKTHISLIDLYAKGVTFKIGLTNARHESESILALINKYKIDFGKATTLLDTWENSIDAFLTQTTKVVVKRDKINFN